MGDPLYQLSLVNKYLPNADVRLTADAQGNPVFTFTPPLTGPEQAQFADLALMAGFGITANITLAEFQAIKPILTGVGKQIVNAPGGTVLTAAQNLASHQGLWKVIFALLRS